MSPYFAFDVTCIDDKNVTVSSDNPNQKQINIIVVETRAGRFIPTAEKFYGVTHKDWSLIVCIEGKGVQTVNTQSGKITTVVPCYLGSVSSIVSNDNKLYSIRTVKTTP